MEEEIGALIRFSDGSVERYGRNRMALHTYFGKLAVYDHIRLLGLEKEQTKVVFEDTSKGLYKPLLEFILRNNYQMNMNKIEVEPGIEQVYMNTVLKDLGDTLPEGWDNEQ